MESLETSGGGPKGLKLTGLLARLVMSRFVKKYLAKHYVDDLNMALRVKKMREGQEGEHLDRKTSKVLREVSKNIMPKSIVMEEDFPSNHKSGKRPILDMVMWVEDKKILHKHYAKPMASRAVVMAKSAFPAATKKNIMLEEGSRRLRNCSPALPWEKKKQHLDSLCISMKEAGHTEAYRRMIITRIFARYQSSLKNHQSKTRRMYRSKAER